MLFILLVVNELARLGVFDSNWPRSSPRSWCSHSNPLQTLSLLLACTSPFGFFFAGSDPQYSLVELPGMSARQTGVGLWENFRGTTRVFSLFGYSSLLPDRANPRAWLWEAQVIIGVTSLEVNANNSNFSTKLHLCIGHWSICNLYKLGHIWLLLYFDTLCRENLTSKICFMNWKHYDVIWLMRNHLEVN